VGRLRSAPGARSALVAVAALLVSRFPDTRKAFSEELDHALHRGSVSAVRLFVAIAAVVLLALWLLP
jgi:hypothetical protein